jgi:DNA-directed RNA polymerase
VSAALVTATRLVAGKNEMFASLAERIGASRGPRHGGRPLWVRLLEHWGDGDLAAGVLFHVVRARLWAESAGIDPLFSTIGTALGTDLVGPGPHADRDLPMKVGCPLLGIAAKTGVIALHPDARGGVHVALTRSTYRRIQKLLEGGAPHVLRRVSPRAPTIVETRKRHDMLVPRPDAPPRVVEAANKVQGTAWRINRAVLAELDAPKDKVTGKDVVANGQIICEARELATLERFYFPVFLDFRGRLYQRGGVLTYTGGSDYARGLLEFADGDVLDDGGIAWLTHHAAQMWGEKEHLTLGEGRYWWRQAGIGLIKRWRRAKHPVQFLAAAFALGEAYEGRPVHLPVRVDATCSGLQHLALLSRDTDLARLVNLWGAHHGNRRGAARWLEIPEDDFYQAIADRTGFPREDVKTVIVPMLYGAGEDTSGMDLAEVREKRPSKRELRDAQTIRDEAGRQAPHAFALLRWFGEVAEAHNAAGLPVRWTAPSGFEAVQDYRYVEKNPTRPDRQAQVIVNGRRVSLVKRFYTPILDKPQQAVSLPSSVVHSLDAALLSEIVAGSGIDRWGVVHDAFCVPVGSVWDLLDEDNPRAMAHVYGPDRIGEWLTAWRAAGIDVPDPPGGAARGTLPREMLGGLRTLG